MLLPARAAAADAAASEAATVTDEVTPAEWDAFVSRHPEGTANHLWGWRSVYERAFDHRTRYLAARRRGALTGVLPLVVFRNRAFGRFAVSLPFVNYGGLLTDDDASARALLDAARELARREGLRHVELRHRGACFPELAAKRHKAAMLLPLAADVEVMWQRLDRKVRNQIRKAEKCGLMARVGGVEQLDDFYGIFATTMRDLGTPVYPRRFFAEVFATFPDRSHTIVVERERQPIAAAITYAHPRSLEVPSAASLREYRALCPGNLLYWTAIQHAIRQRFATLDLGRSTPGEGTFLFKQQWGATAHPMCWEYALLSGDAVPDRNPDNPRFRAAISAWKRLPVSIANAVGPRIVRFLP